MANYYGTARSNYFEVKDEEAFKEAISKTTNISVHSSAKGVCLLSEDECGWNNFYESEDAEEFEEYDIVDIVSKHLVDGAVAIFMEVGAEKLRYMSGYAIAVNSRGERESISLDEIYNLAAGLTNSMKEITTCEY